MNNNNGEDKFNLHSTYLHSAISRETDNDDSISIGSYYSSQFTKSTGFASTVSSQRVNQIQPKAKIVVTKVKKPQNGSKIVPSKGASKARGDKIGIEWSTLAKKKPAPRQILQESMSYGQIKPFISLNKLNFLCGIQQKLGQNGCLCRSPCVWRQNWTRNYEKKDLAVFRQLLDMPPLQVNEIQIMKDLPRTHPQCATFSRNIHYRQMLRQVLVAYSVYDIEIGYVQGVNMIAGILLYHVKNAQQTFWALVEMMEYQELRMIYLDNFTHLREHCGRITSTLKAKVHDLYSHMMELDIYPDCFLNGWLLSLMGTCIPLQYMHQVVDKFRLKGWSYIHQLIVTYLLFLKEYLLMADDQAEFLSNLNTQNSRQLGIQWKDMISNADKLTF